MTSYTKPRTWVAGQTVTAAALNTDLRDDMKNIDERLTLHGITSESALNKVKSALCGVRVTDSGTQSIPNITDTLLTWDGESYDSDGFRDAGQPNRITIPSGLGGYYDISVSVRWASNSSGVRVLWVEDDAGTILGRQMDAAVSGAFTHQTLTFPAALAAGDWIVAYVRQDSGGSLDAAKAVNSSCFFTAHRIFAT